jgi:LEA14-like dessication related protein
VTAQHPARQDLINRNMKCFKNFSVRASKLSLAAGAAVFLAGCAGQQTNVKVPTVSFQGMNFENVETDVAAQHMTMDVLLRFKINNPLGVPLVIPEHQVKLQLDGHDVAVLIQTNVQLVVPAQGYGDEVCRFHFDLARNDFQQYLGRDVPYTLVARVRPVSFANLTLEFEHSDSIRLPLLPKISPIADAPATLAFLGNNATDTIDLTAIRDGMGPFVDGLLNPPDLLGLKKALDLITENISGWNEFKAQWNNFKNSKVKFTVPNGNLEGIQVTVPFRVTNPNEFPIEVPVFAGAAGTQGSASPFTSTKMIPQGASPAAPLNAAARRLDGHGSKDMNLLVTLRWRDLGDSMDLVKLLGVDSGWQKSVEFSGETIFDLGYGPTRIKLDLPITLKKP